MADDTCNPKCKFWKKYKEGCPFYIETTWQPNEATGQVKYCKDCAPKRSVLLQMEMFNSIGGLHRASNEERNMQHLLIKRIAGLVQDKVQIDVKDAEYELLENLEDK